jgi:hypothetical protein
MIWEKLDEKEEAKSGSKDSDVYSKTAFVVLGYHSFSMLIISVYKSTDYNLDAATLCNQGFRLV